MNKYFINKIHRNKKDLVKFKGYLVFSCDGSKLALPNYEEVKKAFNINRVLDFSEKLKGGLFFFWYCG